MKFELHSHWINLGIKSKQVLCKQARTQIKVADLLERTSTLPVAHSPGAVGTDSSCKGNVPSRKLWPRRLTPHQGLENLCLYREFKETVQTVVQGHPSRGTRKLVVYLWAPVWGLHLGVLTVWKFFGLCMSQTWFRAWNKAGSCRCLRKQSWDRLHVRDQHLLPHLSPWLEAYVLGFGSIKITGH